MIRPRYARHQQAPGSMHEIMGIMCAAGALFIFLALISYNPYDPTWFYVTTDAAILTNWCGIVGAHSAAVLLYVFGSSSLFLVILLGVFAYNYMMRISHKQNGDRIVALVILMCCSAAWCYVYRVDFFGVSFPGGLVGMYWYKLLYTFFDAVGASLCLFTLSMVCFVLITRLSFVHVVMRGITLAQKYVYKPVLAQRMYQAACQAGVTCVTFGMSVGTQLKQSLIGVPSEQDVPTPDAYDYEPFDDTLYDSSLWQVTHNTPTHEVVAPPVQKQVSQVPNVQSLLEITHAASVDCVSEPQSAPVAVYTVPDLALFPRVTHERTDQKLMRDLEAQARVLEEKLARFGITGSVTSIKRGPVVTLFEYQPDIDAKISKIVALEDDLALALQALSIRILAPIPGRSVVGFEVSNKQSKDVLLSGVIHSSVYTEFKGKLPLVLGQDSIGDNVVVDLGAMPHLLVAGSTGSGKSVALNAMLVSLLCKCTPDELQLILIDPKRLEFAPYADIAHLIFPIVTDPRKATPVLKWVVKEMEERYATMAKVGSRNIVDYNKDTTRTPLPFIVVVIDELADLMMTAGHEIEEVIARIAQMARAAGIHMIVATQRPSVDVITGLIKANFPSRISFRVASKIDSRTILDCGGADKLVGRGDMLFLDSRASVVRRVHGAYVSDREIENLVQYIRGQRAVTYRDIMEELPTHVGMHEQDELYDEVLQFLQGVDEVSISLLQRRFRIGYNRSARIIDTLEARGRIMPSENGKTRKVIK